MIRDPTIKQQVQEEWDGVRSFQSILQARLNAPGGLAGIGASHGLRNISHCLILLFAFSILEKVLKQLRDEGMFRQQDNRLGKLMYSSKRSVPWRNFPLVDKAREDRNRVAHRQEILERADSWNYIDGIEAELLSWKVIVNPKSFKH